jgi:hypothetical protein
MTIGIFNTALGCLLSIFCIGVIDMIIQRIYFWKLIRVLHKEHREEWLREGEPYNFLLEGKTGGSYRAEKYLLSKWQQSPPEWITASIELSQVCKRLQSIDRFSKRLALGVVLIALIIMMTIFTIRQI